eukprot:Gb_15993 [translate_table: standard]
MGTNRRAWTAKEDMILSDFVETHGEAQWASLPVRADAYLSSLSSIPLWCDFDGSAVNVTCVHDTDFKCGLKRRGKSCRLRWFNYLRPNIKRGNISADEDDLIIRLHRLLGNRWSLIAKRLPGRTDNEIKNYWNTHLRKKLEKDGSAHKLIPKTIESYWNAHNNNVPTNVDDHKTYKAAADGSHATGEIMSTPSANRVSQSTPVLCAGKTNRECLHSELDTDLVDKSAADEVHEPKSLLRAAGPASGREDEFNSEYNLLS